MRVRTRIQLLVVVVGLLFACLADANDYKHSSKKSKKGNKHDKKKNGENNNEDGRPCGLPTLGLNPATTEWTVGQDAEVILNVGYAGPTNGQVQDVHIQMTSSAPSNVVHVDDKFKRNNTRPNTFIVQKSANSEYGLTLSHFINLDILRNPNASRRAAYPFTLTFVATAPRCINGSVTATGTYFIVPREPWPLEVRLYTDEDVQAGSKNNKVHIEVENVSDYPQSNYTVTLTWASIYTDVVVFRSATPVASNLPSNPLKWVAANVPTIPPHKTTKFQATYDAPYDGKVYWTVDVKPLVYPNVEARSETEIQNSYNYNGKKGSNGYKDNGKKKEDSSSNEKKKKKNSYGKGKKQDS